MPILLGVAVGVGGYTFVYAKGGSYLGRDPAVCANRHVMQDHYDAWLKASHRAVACHAPHDLVRKYWVEAENGFWHSFAFTTGWFHEPIRIRAKNRAVTERTCRDCHVHPPGTLRSRPTRAELRSACRRRARLRSSASAASPPEVPRCPA